MSLDGNASYAIAHCVAQLNSRFGKWKQISAGAVDSNLARFEDTAGQGRF